MISYPVSRRDLHQKIEKEIPTTRNSDGTPRKNGRRAWLERAAKETRRLKRERTYSEGVYGEFWGELKSILSKFQGDGKCAYCERKLALRSSGRPDGDVEHYRPKNGVTYWWTGHLITPGTSDKDAYYLLAFNPRNYLLSCRTCNQDFKQNFFPIAGKRVSNSSNPNRLRAEKPYLLHPLDPVEQDIETILTFDGLNPVPTAPKGSTDYWRAVVSIELLGLTEGKRLDLDLERAQCIVATYVALTFPNRAEPTIVDTLVGLTNNKLPHRNCVRSFARLYATDPHKAKKIAEAASGILLS